MMVAPILSHQTTTSLPRELLPFIPPVLYQWDGFTDSLDHEVACLFVDVAGFTRLSERLSLKGAEGAELLERTIARYFNDLMDIVEQYQGLPLKVSGDALTIAFSADGSSLPEITRRAVQCAIELGRTRPDSANLTHLGLEQPLLHKVGVGAGMLIAGQVGDPRLRAEYVFAGEALDGAATAEHRASPGEVWVSPQVVLLLERLLPVAHRDDDGFARLSLEGESRRGFRALDDLGPPSPAAHIRERLLERYRNLIPHAVLECAEAGSLDYLSRHQNLSVLFAGCPRLRVDSTAALQQIDAHYRAMGRIIDQYGGFLSEFEAGDKGAKLIILFGAPHMLENHARQAAQCAQALQEAARELRIVEDQRIGLATGRLYVGRIGCRSLFKYSALGDRMNLAARLMVAAPPWTVLAEQSVVAVSAPSVSWGPVQTLHVKGKLEAIDVRPIAVTPGRTFDRRGLFIQGRRQEQRRLKALVERLGTGVGGLLRLNGDAGVGKTRLLGAMQRLGERIKAAVFWWGNNPAHHGRPFAAWRPLLNHLMGADEPMSMEDRLAHFRNWINALPPETSYTASLLASVLELPWTLPPILERLPSEQLLRLRRQAVLDALAGLTSPVLLIVDNATELDLPSTQVLTEAVPLLGSLPLLVATACRTGSGHRKDPLEALAGQPNVETLELMPLSPAASARYACQHLKVPQLDVELGHFVQEKAAGNPLLIQTWLDYLRDHGRLRLQDGKAWLRTLRDGASLPHALEALFLAQLERIPYDAQLTVRVASIIGRSFSPAEVGALHPSAPPLSVVRQHLRQANQADLIWRDREHADHYFFCRDEVLEAIHDSLPFHLRRTLHAQRVEQLFDTFGGEPQGDVVLTLARHYEYVEDREGRKACFWQALEVCKERFDHPGSIHWARQLRKLHEEDGECLKLGQALRGLESALGSLGEVEERMHVLDAWVALARDNGCLRGLVSALQVRARVCQRTGKASQGEADLYEALEKSRDLGEHATLVDTLICASSVHGEAGRLPQALAAAEEAVTLADKLQPGQRFQLYVSRGFVLDQLGRSQEAYQDCLTALALVEASDDEWGKAILQGNLAVQLWSMGHPEEGHAALLSSLELKKRLGDRREQAMANLNVGFSFYRQGDLAKARGHTREAMTILAHLRYVRGELVATGNLGEILWVEGSLEEAAEQFARVDLLLASHPQEAMSIENLVRRGELALTQERLAEAGALFEAALDRAGARQLAALVCAGQEGLGEVRRRQGRLEEARSLFESAMFQASHNVDLLSFPQRLWWRASLLSQAEGRLEEARQLVLRAAEWLDTEQRRFASRTIRSRIARAFPWNQEVLLARKRCGLL